MTETVVEGRCSEDRGEKSPIKIYLVYSENYGVKLKSIKLQRGNKLCKNISKASKKLKTCLQQRLTTSFA